MRGKQVGVSCIRGLVLHRDCVTCSAQLDHPCEVPADILQLMRQKPFERHADHDAFSPTGLMDCDRKSALKMEHDWYVNVTDSWPMIRGTMIHAIMENTDEMYPGAVSVIREIELESPIDTSFGTQRMTGKPDAVVVLSVDGSTYHVRIVDYKSTGEIKHDFIEPRRDHVRQLNMYAWLVRRALSGALGLDIQVEVDELELVYADMRKVRRFISGSSLKTRGKLTQRSPRRYEEIELSPIRIFSDMVVEKFIREAIERKLSGRTTLPPMLTGDDVWRCGYCELKDICYELASRGVA